ncbi:MAG: hypothetical protein HC908_00800 [Calothrix sp. SM1_7_51]|nr:hypothetical protein [Calothrix sp. SM1_7_51]
MTCKSICHNDLFTVYEQGVSVRQIFTKPAWLQVVHGTNVKNFLDVNSVIQPINKLKKNFTLDLEMSQYYQISYFHKFICFFYRFLFVNKQKLPLGLRTRRLLSAIFPEVASIYLNYSLWMKERISHRPQISITTARSLCENWVSEYENLVGSREERRKKK